MIAMLLVLGVAGYTPVAHAQSPETTTVSVELMAFPFEGLKPPGPVTDTATVSVELMAFPFEGLNPRGPVANPAAVAEAPVLLPVTGGEAWPWPAMGLALAGLGLMGGGWLVRRQHQT